MHCNVAQEVDRVETRRARVDVVDRRFEPPFITLTPGPTRFGFHLDCGRRRRRHVQLLPLMLLCLFGWPSCRLDERNCETRARRSGFNTSPQLAQMTQLELNCRHVLRAPSPPLLLRLGTTVWFVVADACEYRDGERAAPRHCLLLELDEARLIKRAVRTQRDDVVRRCCLVQRRCRARIRRTVVKRSRGPRQRSRAAARHAKVIAPQHRGDRATAQRTSALEAAQRAAKRGVAKRVRSAGFVDSSGERNELVHVEPWHCIRCSSRR